MRILVTGGSGVVGTPLVQELRKRGHEVWILDISHHHDPQYIRCDISEFRQLQEALTVTEFDLVYHLAAEFGRFNGEATMRECGSPMLSVPKTYEAAGKRRFRLVFSSSSEIYGDYRGIMFEDLSSKQPLKQLNDYAISKWVNEQQIMNSASRFGTDP